MTCHVTCQKYQFGKSGFIAIYTCKNITTKLFLPVKAFDPGLKLLEWIRHNKMAYDINKVTYQQRMNRPHGLVSLSEHVENYPSKISNKLLMNTGYLRVFALFYFVNWDDVCTFPYCQYEKPIRWVVLWEFLAVKPILLMLFYIPCRCCFRPFNCKGYGVFKG